MSRIRLIWILSVLLLGCGSDGYEEDAGYEDSPGTFWQLEDDSEFSVQLEPWPPKAGPSRLIAVAGPGDWTEGPFSGTVAYRIGELENNFEDWVPMKKTGEADWAVTFEADAVLPAGDVYIQFRVKSRIFDRPVELTDWRVKITP